MIDELPGIYAAQCSLEEGLKDVRHAYWVNLRVGRELPATLKKLKRLRVLNASGSLTQLPEWLPELSELRHLRLDENRLKTVPASLAKLKSLRWLALTQNEVTSLPPEIGAIQTLERLWLDDNPKLKVLPNELFTLSALEFLDLSNTGISELPDEIQGLTSLRSLVLDKTPLLKNRKARERLKSLFEHASWSDGTLVIERAEQRPARQVLKRAQAIKVIQTDTLPDRANLSGVDLSKGVFESVYLKGQCLAGANLNHSKWKKCVLSVDLSKADLRGAVFEDCIIEGDYEALTFNGVDARGAKFIRCVMVNVGFVGADLRGASVELAAVDYGPLFKNAKVEGATFVSRGAQSTKWTDVKLKGAVLKGPFLYADFDGAVLAGCDLREATFPDSHFEGAVLDGALLGPQTLAGTDVEKQAVEAKPMPATKASAQEAIAWVGTVASEGGPVMFADLGAIEPWGGSVKRQGERDDDYSLMLKKLKGTSVALDGRAFWSVGPGCYQVGVAKESGDIVVAVSMSDDDEPSLSGKGKPAGLIEVPSGRLVVAWAPIAAAEISKKARSWKKGVAALARSSWALGLVIEPGTYRLVACEDQWSRLVRQ